MRYWVIEYANPYFPTLLKKKWPSAITRLTVHLMCGLKFDLLILWAQESVWLYMTLNVLPESQVSLNNTQTNKAALPWKYVFNLYIDSIDDRISPNVFRCEVPTCKVWCWFIKGGCRLEAHAWCSTTDTPNLMHCNQVLVETWVKITATAANKVCRVEHKTNAWYNMKNMTYENT